MERTKQRDSSAAPHMYSNAASRPDVTEFESDTTLVIGIDFGTTFTGVAYAYQFGTGTDAMSISDMRNANRSMHIVRQWPSQSGASLEKTPTVIAYKNGNPPNWGARVKFGEQPQFAHFKLGLQENLGRLYHDSDSSVLGGYLVEHDWRHPQLPHKRAVDVTADYLTCVVQYVLNDQLPMKYGAQFLQNQKVCYMITVPAVWSEKAKELTRQAAVSAGIPRRKLMLITEPEAAAIYCSVLCKEVDLREGSRFLVCDAGGGTVVSFINL
jgi:molecular chaperone DnaK (HSP70)